VAYFDAHVPSIDEEGWGLTSVPDPLQSAGRVDCVVIITDHAGVDYLAIAKAAPLVFDARNALQGASLPEGRVVRL
jgi:UDP-N-acetyl-D-glucosamine dehydrogenase